MREKRPILTGPSEVHFEADKELYVLSQKLDELLGEIQEFDRDNRENDFIRIKSRLLHTEGRLQRVSTEGEGHERKKSHLTFLCKELFESLEDAYKITNLRGAVRTSILDEPNEILQSSNQSFLDQVQPRECSPIDDPPVERLIDTEINRSVGPCLRVRDSGLLGVQERLRDLSLRSNQAQAAMDSRRVSFANFDAELLPPQSTNQLPAAVGQLGGVRTSSFVPVSGTHAMSNNYFPLYKWNVSFDGTGSVTSFLERLEELRESRQVSKDQMFQSAVDLFKGDALLWFRTRRGNFRD